MARHPDRDHRQRPPEPRGAALDPAAAERPLARLGRYLLSGLIGAAVLGGFYLTTFHSYLLFHALAEGFSITVGFAIFMLAWNSRRFTQNSFLLLLGVAYLCVSAVDLVHALSYQGMGVIASASGNLAAQLWVGARFVESLSLLIAPLFIGRRLRADLAFNSYVAILALILGSIFLWKVFPVCFVEGVGLTPFKKISEYLISLILLGAVGTLLWKRSSFHPAVLRLLIASVVLTMASELAFTLYTDVYGFFNLIGHYLKIVSFYAIYAAVLRIGLESPYSLIFRDLKQSEQALETERDFVSAVLATVGSLVVVFDREGRIVRANRAAEELTGYRLEEARGKHFLELGVLPPEHVELAVDAFREASADSRAAQFEADLVTKNGSRRRIAWSGSALLDSDGAVEYVIATGVDVTERTQAERQLRHALAEKEVLLAETHHRVRNNLQIIESLLELSRQRVDSQEAAAVLREAAERVFTMGLIHSELYRTERFDEIDMGVHVRNVAHHLAEAHASGHPDIRLTAAASEVRITLPQAVPCGLIVNELISNAYRHAFTGRREGTIEVALEELSDGTATFRVKDDGIGMPDDFSIEQPETLGLQLVKGLAAQLGGTVEFLPGPGTEVVVRFPLAPHPPAAQPTS